MKLIIGGNSSGKIQRILELGYSHEDIYKPNSNEVPTHIEYKVLYKLNSLVDNLLKNEIEPIEYISSLIDNSKLEIIVCDEVGCGVVPMERYERDYRECVGRVCCMIAKRANVVERIYCGIATVIKSDES